MRGVVALTPVESFGGQLRERAVYLSVTCTGSANKLNKKAVLPQGNRAMPQVFFSVEVRQQHSLQV